jgi:CrcB protein
LKILLFIGIGGFAGAILRYLLNGYAHQWARTSEFPYGTLLVNILGCLLIGFLTVLVDSHGTLTSESRAFLFVGLLGSLTTYSTFGNETVNLLRNGASTAALLNVSIHLVMGLAAVWSGRLIAFIIWK